jgi:predicted nucleic acid-binding protein
MPFMVESDFLIALSRVEDQYHAHARRIISSGEKLLLSPYSLTEINLASRAVGKNISGFMEQLAKMMEGYDNVQLIPDKAGYHAKAAALEKEHDLSFFDSLHAAAAIEGGYTIISADGRYEKIKDLHSINPRKFRSSG